MSDHKKGVLLANLGSPTAPTVPAVRKFLEAFLGDKRVVNLPRPLWLIILYCFVLPFRPKKSAEAYAKIWDDEKGSPLTFLTRQLTQKVAEKISTTNPTVLLDHVMSYGEPSMATQLRRFKDQGIKDITILPLYPQYSSTTTASVYDAFVKELNQWWHLPTFRFISDYHEHNSYINALAQTVRAAWALNPKNQMLVMSFHGLPEMLTEKGDPYFYQCQRTAKLLADELELKEHEWRLVFQSRFGKAEWLKPYCADTLAALPQEGVKSVDLICAGFAVDCLETLEEIAMENQHVFIEAGGEAYTYIPALNDSELGVQVILDVLASHLPN